MKTLRFALALVLPILVVGLGACDDDDITDPLPGGPFDLTFEGDASYQGPHADQDIYLVVEDAGGEVIASESGTVSADDDPAFSFTFDDILEEDESYTVSYWIDSNFDEEEGTEGVCDEPAVDHQWSVEITAVEDDVEETVVHDAEDLTPVCDLFAFDLEFSGDATFQDAHGGQDIHVAVVHEGLDAVVALETMTVDGDADPSFEFTFEGRLTRDQDYHVDYWIDSNFDAAGTEGECDEPDIDHQWRIGSDMEEGLASVEADVAFEDTHRPGETEDVCATFEGEGA